MMSTDKTSVDYLQRIHKLQDKIKVADDNSKGWNDILYQINVLNHDLNLVIADEAANDLKMRVKDIDELAKRKTDELNLEVGTMIKELGYMRTEYYQEDDTEEKEVPELSEEDGKPDFEF